MKWWLIQCAEEQNREKPQMDAHTAHNSENIAVINDNEAKVEKNVKEKCAKNSSIDLVRVYVSLFSCFININKNAKKVIQKLEMEYRKVDHIPRSQVHAASAQI